MIDILRQGGLSLERLARWCVRHRRVVLVLWLVVLAITILSARVWGGETADNFEIPGAESQKAFDLLQSRFPQQAGDTATIVFRADSGVDDVEARARIEAALAEAMVVPQVTDVTSPFEVPSAISSDGRTAFATVQFDSRAQNIKDEHVDQLLAIGRLASGPGLKVEMTGPVVTNYEFAGPQATEAVALAAAAVVLLITFGSVIAMGLPVILALFTLGGGLSLVAIFANVVDISRFVPTFAAMIGLAVAVDYALLIVSRYRQALATGVSAEDAAAVAISTAGRTVIFAGTTVAIAVLGLFLIGIPTIATVGLATSIVLALTVIAAVTLLPALLGFSGHAIDRFHIPKLVSHDASSQGTIWFRLSRSIQGHPWPFAIGSLALLLLLATPVLDMRLGSSDAGSNPTSFTSRRAYDLLTEAFGPGFNGPLLIALDLSSSGNGVEAVAEISDAVASDPDVAEVREPAFNPAGDTAIIWAVPASSPQSQATDQLVHRLRGDVIPGVLEGTNTTAFVGGQTAAFIDIGQKIGDRMPVFMAAVIGVSMLLLMAIFRSVLIPLKAAVMNLLSLGAAFGVIVAVFQWGWGADFLGVKNGPVESFVPMMMFAVLFGLSMDYEMFLLSRIREEYVRTCDNDMAVANGLALTARVITAAAAVMVAVFLSFMLGDSRVIKLVGLGLAAAIFVDATVIRLVLVPSIMSLLGSMNWWLPRRIDRFLPRLVFERPVELVPEEELLSGEE